MSFHNKPNYQIPELIEALKAHRLPHDTPSQLADSFRIGFMACRDLAQANSVLYDPKAVLDVFNSARAGSENPVGYMRGIRAVIAHWESRPEPHRWMVPAPADSAQEDAARYRFIRDVPYSDDVRSVLVHQQNAAMDRVIDAARKQGASHDR